jgi:hypothetical protein
MPNKERERFYLQQLRACSIGLPDGETRDSESPDFLIFAETTLGVEFTEFHLPAGPGERPHQEVQSLQEEVITIAEKSYASGGGPALYVHAIFGRHGRLAKQTVRQIGDALADALLSYPVPRAPGGVGVKIPRELLPREIAHVHVHGSVDGVDHLWQCGYGSWVAPLTPAHIQTEIERKRRKAPLARQKCERVWLVIVQDIGTEAHACELTDAARLGPYINIRSTDYSGSNRTRHWRLILATLSSNNRLETDLRTRSLRSLALSAQP